MKYYFIKILTDKETNAKNKSIYEYDEEKKARAGIYSGYSAALNDASICQVLCMLIDEYGSPLTTLTWKDAETVIPQSIHNHNSDFISTPPRIG